MSKAVCFEPVAGASGDMILAALCDLGADPAALVSILRAAGLTEVDVRFERRVCRHGLVCGYVEVLESGRQADGGPGGARAQGHRTGNAHEHEHEHGSDHDHEHGHGHGHENGNGNENGNENGNGNGNGNENGNGNGNGNENGNENGNGNGNENGNENGNGRERRGLREILELIARLEAPGRVRERAAAIFRRLGEAEAAVHGVPVEEVHFHEVGAVDSITDIVGICLALEQLGVERVYCSALTIGYGTIRCAHGIMPNPAPATARLLEGAAVIRLPIGAELTTPTAAAVLTTLSAGNWDNLPLQVLKTGSGHGRKEFDALPNLLRAFLVETDDTPVAGQDTVTVMECDIDDQTGEVMGALSEELLQAGALDVSLTAVQMKKNRPGTRLTVLSRPADASRLAQQVLSRSSSIGVRTWPARRIVLPRGKASVETPWGPVACKRIERPDGVELAPEFESARRVAGAASVAVRHVLDAARRWEPRQGS